MKNSFLYFILISFIFTGCTKIENIKKLPPSGNKFQQYLTKFYIEFAESEAEQYDWIDSEHFATKAMHTAYGKITEPENPKKWNIPKTILPSLMAAYNQLLEQLTPHNIEAYPEDLAKAQFFFDVWVEEQEENWQIDRIEEARENFYLALNNIITKSSASNNEISKTAIKEKPKNLKKKKKKDTHKGKNNKSPKKTLEQSKNINPVNKKTKDTPTKKTPISKIITDKAKDTSLINLKAEDYNIIFKPASKEIAEQSIDHLKNIAKYVKQKPKIDILINAYSKKLSDDEANLELSKERALLIKKQLIKAGASDNNITIFAFGNSEAEELNNDDKQKIDLYIGD